MALPDEGEISLQDIGTEFSSPSPYILSNFYNKGWPPSPANGTISFSDFHGRKDYKFSMVYPEKPYYAYPNSPVIIPFSYILDGIYDELNVDNEFTISEFSSIINGTIHIRESYIEFTPTTTTGGTSGFSVTLLDIFDFPIKFDVSMTVVDPALQTITTYGECFIEEITEIKETIGQEKTLLCEILTE